MKNFQFNPFDLIFLVVIGIGLLRGKKRGISEELLDVIQWLTIVVVGGFFYRVPGGLLASYTQFPIIMADIVGYLLIAGVVTFLFKTIKRAVGEKLIKGDTFGRFEYYLGMIAGAVRYFCMLLFVLAIINAKYSTAAERAANAKMQQDNLGSISFPTWPTMQQSIFEQSYSGKTIAKNMGHLLLQRVPPGPLRPGETIGKRRERAVNEVIGGGR